MAPLTDAYQAEVARIALDVARRFGFALGGGQALVAHGIVRRGTEDIDLFTDNELDAAVPAAAREVRAALDAAGLTVRDVDSPADLSDLFEGFDLGMVEFEVERGDKIVRLTLARLNREHSPVIMDIGPVMHVDDVVGSKVCAAVGRGEVRDWVDVAAALDRYPLSRLIALARTLDPGLGDDDFTDAGRRLDNLSGQRFRLYGVTAEQLADVRARLACWPRPDGRPDGAAG